jgi:hypothetical protein
MDFNSLLGIDISNAFLVGGGRNDNSKDSATINFEKTLNRLSIPAGLANVQTHTIGIKEKEPKTKIHGVIDPNLYQSLMAIMK